MADDGRVRLLKALKVSYWKQFEHGMLSREAVQALTNLADTAMDDEDRYKVNYCKTPDIIPNLPTTILNGVFLSVNQNLF